MSFLPSSPVAAKMCNMNAALVALAIKGTTRVIYPNNDNDTNPRGWRETPNVKLRMRQRSSAIASPRSKWQPSPRHPHLVFMHIGCRQLTCAACVCISATSRLLGPGA